MEAEINSKYDALNLRKLDAGEQNKEKIDKKRLGGIDEKLEKLLKQDSLL